MEISLEVGWSPRQTFATHPVFIQRGWSGIWRRPRQTTSRFLEFGNGLLNSRTTLVCPKSKKSSRLCSVAGGWLFKRERGNEGPPTLLLGWSINWWNSEHLNTGALGIQSPFIYRTSSEIMKQLCVDSRCSCITCILWWEGTSSDTQVAHSGGKRGEELTLGLGFSIVNTVRVRFTTSHLCYPGLLRVTSPSLTVCKDHYSPFWLPSVCICAPHRPVS